MTDALALAVPLLACPLCGADLELAGDPGAPRTLRCGAKHSFDVARQGYVNLLSGAGAKGLAADTPAMVLARERVHAAGVFAPLTARLAQVLGAFDLPTGGLLDIGCGTGYYTAAALDALPDRVGVGLDLSTAAAKRAARAHPHLAAIVADAWATLPLRDASMAVATCVFAPRQAKELLRVLAPGGRLVLVTPGPEHLHPLVDELGLLSVDPDKDERLARQLADFDVLTTESVEHTVEADRDLMVDVLAMGPSAWHHTTTELAALVDRGPQPRTLRISVRIAVLAARH